MNEKDTENARFRKEIRQAIWNAIKNIIITLFWCILFFVLLTLMFWSILLENKR